MLNFRAALIAAGALAASALAAAVTPSGEIPKRAPYHAVRWEEQQPVVRIGSEWLDLLSIDGLTVGEIVSHCENEYGAKARKRFEEDLVEVLLGMDHEPGETVRLVVRDRDDGEKRVLDEVAMTLENRRQIWLAANGWRLFGRGFDHPFPKRAPFDAIRWDDDEPIARVDDEWVTLVSIDGVAVDEIVAYCKESFHSRWRKRFGEDLVEAMSGMGHEPGETVRLVVRAAGDASNRTLEAVPMTAANRQAVWHAAQARSMRGDDANVVLTDETTE